jgi:hypothetical protein
MTPEEPACNELEAALMMGRMNGARSDITNTVSVSVTLSTSVSRPGIFSIMDESFRTTLSLN